MRATALVVLTQGLCTHVDVIDLPWFLNWGWCACVANNRGRLVHYVHGGGRLLHRWIMGRPRGLVIDHINNDGLDNRRCNLRVVTYSENVKNRAHGRDAPLSLGILPPGVPIITREALRACGPDRLALAALVAAAPLSPLRVAA